MRNDPTVRALQLMSLLQSHRYWRCSELADRLEVTERTVRRDVDRLRELGYPVDTSTGRYGGYRLAAGTHLPPLMFDDDEAVAIAVGLRYAAVAAIEGIDETSLRALTKIEALLPHRLRRRVSAVHSNVTSTRRVGDRELVDPETLTLLAAACRDHECVRFEYRRGEDTMGRFVEPHELVTAGERWYLVAWDRDRDDWRTFRLDRLSGVRPVGNHFASRDVAGGDAARYVAASLGSFRRPQEATLAIHAPLTEVEGILRWMDHTVDTSAVDRCVVRIRGEDVGRLAMSVAEIGLAAPVVVREPAELADAIRVMALQLRETAE